MSQKYNNSYNDKLFRFGNLLVIITTFDYYRHHK